MEKGIYKVNGDITISEQIIYGIQHVISMCTGVLVVPLIIGSTLGIDKEALQYLIGASFMMAGIGTLIQSSGFFKGIGIKLLAIEGVSFIGMMSLSSIALKYKGIDPMLGLQVMFGATIVVGAITMLIAPFFGKILKYFPFLVSGIIVTMLGLSLMPTAIAWIGGGFGAGKNFGSFLNLGLALFTFVVILLVQKYGKGTFANLAILFGIALGTILGGFLGFTNLDAVRNAGILSVNRPFLFGIPKFELSAILSLSLVQIATLVEGIGNQINLTNASGEQLDNKNLVSGIKGHGFTTMLAGLFNSFPHGIFAQNIGLVEISKVTNRKVGITSGLLLILVSLFPKVISFITIIPDPVLGGAAIIMFGVIVANGIRMIGSISFTNNQNIIVVAASITMGLIPVMNPAVLSFFPGNIKLLFENAIVLGGLTAVILNAYFNGIEK
ncbi:MAG: nucleobase:cation symporter-2 family protein [Fusobacteriaceae bacterium]